MPNVGRGKQAHSHKPRGWACTNVVCQKSHSIMCVNRLKNVRGLSKGNSVSGEFLWRRSSERSSKILEKKVPSFYITKETGKKKETTYVSNNRKIVDIPGVFLPAKSQCPSCLGEGPMGWVLVVVGAPLLTTKVCLLVGRVGHTSWLGQQVAPQNIKS